MSKEEKEITLKDIHNDLRELLTWTKFAGIKDVKPILESHLDTDVKKQIYSLSNGKNSSYEIARAVGNESVRRSISNYWKEWDQSNLGELIPAQGGGTRFKSSFNLIDFSITIPEFVQSLGKETPQTKQPTTEVKSNDS